jgi:hypothetical protein
LKLEYTKLVMVQRLLDIEARLSKFALEVLYSPKITDWGVSYDGRRAEPNNLQ